MLLVHIQGGPKKTIPKICLIYIINSTPASAQNVNHNEQLLDKYISVIYQQLLVLVIIYLISLHIVMVYMKKI